MGLRRGVHDPPDSDFECVVDHGPQRSIRPLRCVRENRRFPTTRDPQTYIRGVLDHARSITDGSVVAPAYLSVQQAAEQVGLKHLAIRRAIQRNELPATKLCSRIRIHPSDLNRWIAANRVVGQRSPPAVGADP